MTKPAWLLEFDEAKTWRLIRLFQALAIQYNDVPDEMPTPESLRDILDELDRLRATTQSSQK